MLRQLHSLTGLIAALLVTVLAVTGAILAISPIQERLQARVPADGQLSVADLAARVAVEYPGAEQIQRTASGLVIVYFSDAERAGAELIDPQTGKALAPYENPSFTRWMKKLHRSLLFDTSGRVVVGLGAAGMLLLSLTGVWLLAARQGGWRRILGPVRGTTGQRLHGVFGRFALLGLMLSASTGVYLSATTFALLPEPREAEAPLVAEVAAAIPKPIQSLAALQSTDLNDLRELVYPRRGDSSDSFYLRSRDGAGLVSPSTGAFLSYQTNDTRWRLHEFIYQLHTGDGLWWLGLLLGLSALAVPVLAVTGAWIWWARRRALPKLANNSRAGVADTVILVGTESNSTWGFAATLHDALVQAGHKVLTTAMNQLAPEYPVAERILVLTSTYGDADAPASARRPRNENASRLWNARTGNCAKRTRFCAWPVRILPRRSSTAATNPERLR
ncbi:sulfite reductase (NADPH) flavoprotein alpha-component [Halopseudomonas formosensis]|uniref:Sulfite reductase (NADPH) flavoprotein alpha-component n=1 Tax=Halopseudomonas formosensis TaxID=1002526 RepID=A0A1I6BYB1_9GAMM|nr:sulfite reductase (NADPH) flavoprotein alpha-component [Halopseudomonas formosensis]